MPQTPLSTDVRVGERLRLRRKQLGLSQQGLAAQLGITYQQVQKYERGVNRVGASRLQAIANALEVPIGYFSMM
jgi:transcriptional regulator with XRE-family HTH domain